MTRVDKADILELTVFHLMQLQRQQRSVSMATEIAAYNAGFKDCACEAVTYLSSNRTINDNEIRALSNHLHSSYIVRSRSHDGKVSMATQKETNRYIDGPHGSTPLRPVENFVSHPQAMNITGYSPIPVSSDVTHLVGDVTHLPELTSSFVTDGLNSSHDSDLSSFGSSWSNFRSASSSTDNSGDSSSNMVSSDGDVDSEVVTIGDGKENQIGHVIKDKIWRPF